MKKLSVFLIILTISGCALYSDYYKGKRCLDKGDMDEAITFFEKALQTSPNDPKIICDIGVAHYKKDELQTAVKHLEKVKSLDPNYGKCYLYLGMIYEKQGSLQKAIDEYNSCSQKSRYTRIGRELKARISIIMRKQIALEVQQAVQNEKTLMVENIPENTIAVWYFRNVTNNEKYAPLSKGLTDMLITDLNRVKSITVVERMRLQLLMDELKLSQSALVDQSTTPRFGKLLGVRKIVNGSFAIQEEKQIRLNALFTDIATAQTLAQADVSGELDRFFVLEKELVLNALDEMGVTLTQEERDAIRKVPTESFMAFLAYSKGLDYEDKGMYPEASEEFRRAKEIDPDFSQANEKFQGTQTLAQAPMIGETQEVTRLEEAQVEMEKKEELLEPEQMPDVSSADRLQVVDLKSAEGFIPEDEAAETEERTTTQKQTSSVINITVEW